MKKDSKDDFPLKFLNIITGKDKEGRETLKSNLIESISPYIKYQSQHKYIEAKDIEKILPSDPLELARIMVEDHNDIAPESEKIKDEDLNRVKGTLGLINIHFKSLIEEIISEINFDLDRNTSYESSIKIIEARGYKRIYDKEVLVSKKSTIRDLEYLKSRNLDTIDLKIEGDELNYKVRYGNIVFYNDQDGTMITFSGRKDNDYGPSMSFHGETNKYPNQDKIICASSQPVNYQEAFSISLNQELLFSRIERMLELGIGFNKKWHHFKDYIFSFDNDKENISAEEVIESIRKNHPYVLDNMIRENSDIEQWSRLAGKSHSNEYIEGDCHVKKIMSVAEKLSDDELDDIVIRAVLFDSKYVCKDKTGRYSKGVLERLHSEGLDNKEIERYYSVFISEADSRGLSFSKMEQYNKDKITKVVEQFDKAEIKAFLKVHKEFSSINKDLILKLKNKAGETESINKNKLH